MDGGYKTLFGYGEREFSEKRSRFIGYCQRAETEAEALGFIETIRKKHAAATHNVYAYSLRYDNLTRYSDDGEPQGTAGLPVLGILTNRSVADAVVVVTRYFGGTLLGTGGLVRAYSKAAAEAVDAAGVAVMERRGVYSLKCGYAEYESALRLLESLGAINIESEFLADVSVTASLKSETEPILFERFRELTRGAGVPQKFREEFAAVRE